MLKRFFLSLALLAGLLSPAFGAGSISLSLTQQFDTLGKPLNGGLLYFYAAGTTTPQSAYQDSGLTLPWPNPITLDSAGRIPQLFFADGSIKVRLTNSAGVVQLAADGILVIGASSGGGGGSPVDATTVLATGDLKVKYGTGALTGFVRANGRTIGSATSGAAERANSDTQSLFEYLWGADANLAVSTGRGVSANADWVANKTIALPDWRGQALGALADMGNTATTALTSTYFGTDPTVLGAAGGVQSRGLGIANMVAHTHSGTTGVEDATHTHTTSVAGVLNGGSVSVGGGGSFFIPSTQNYTSGTESANHHHAFTTDSGSGMSATAFGIVGPMKLATVYLKL